MPHHSTVDRGLLASATEPTATTTFRRNTMPETVIITNPESGTGDHVEAVRNRADVLGYEYETTGRAGEAVLLARNAAASGASTIVAAGGDGTVNEVVHGIDRADAFDSVTLGLIPVGTGNNFAKQIGITDLDHAFDVIEDGERRRIDLGTADGHLFVNSAIAGLTANSSGETTPEMKNRLGVLSYVITTLQTMSNFDGIRLTVDTYEGESESPSWSGEAILVLVGNGRRFRTGDKTQANMEDGLLEIAIVEKAPTSDLMGAAFVEQLLGGESSEIVRNRAPAMTVRSHDPEAIRFSLDGEMVQEREFSLGVRPKTLSLAVGETYDPDPD